MRDDRTLVKDIIEQCNWIEDHIRFYGENMETFLSNRRYQDNVVLSLERFGEAVNNLSVKLTTKHPEIDWPGIVGLRIIIAHHYWKLDLNQIWHTAVEEMPVFKNQFEAILDELNASMSGNI